LRVGLVSNIYTKFCGFDSSDKSAQGETEDIRDFEYNCTFKRDAARELEKMSENEKMNQMDA
jgi:hypothetical protein